MRTNGTPTMLALLALLIGGRAAGAVTIAQLEANPEQYDRQTVTVSGTVDMALPVRDESAYYLRDGAAKITVVSRTAPPSNGTALTVTGTLRLFHEGDGGPDETKFPPWIFETSRTPGP